MTQLETEPKEQISLRTTARLVLDTLQITHLW